MLFETFWLFFSPERFLEELALLKNAAKRTRQHAMKNFWTHKSIWVRVNQKNGHTVAVVRASPKLRLVKGRLPSKVVFHQRSSSIKGHLPSKFVFHINSL